MTEFRASLVLLPPAAGVEPDADAFESWLRGAGWEPERLELRPSPDHETLGYRLCAVEECDRPAWGQADQGLCSGCAIAWRRNGRPDRELFNSQPPSRIRRHHVVELCSVTREGKRCARPARWDGLCRAHADLVRKSNCDPTIAVTTFEPLSTHGPCRVAACDREAETATHRLCFTHAERWRKLCKRAAPISLEQWCRTSSPVGDGRRVTFAGLEPHVARQILYGIFIRSRRGSQTRLHSLQRVVEFLRQFEPTDLKLLTDIQMPPKWPKACRALLNQIMGTARYGDCSPEDFRHADVWPGNVFSRGRKLDFRGISQPWLRAITQDWCWDNLNRFDSFDNFVKTVNEVGYFSEYLRSNVTGAGEDISVPDRSTVVGFAAYLASLVQARAPRHRSRRSGMISLWSRNLQADCLYAVQRVLKYGRETDRMNRFAGSFMITDDMMVKKVPLIDREDAGDALPTVVMQQLFTPDYLARLGCMNEGLPRLLRVAAETGRRPNELLSLGFSCLDTESVGGPYLIYTESKVTGGQQRRLPILTVVVDTVRAQQDHVRDRYPDTDPKDLRLFPRPTMNPHGYHPSSAATFGKTLRTWVDRLPRLDSEVVGEDGNPLPFDRAKICAYSFRHTYAQRHADAGTPPDVLKELMGHEKIETTMGYYRIPQKRRREAAELVGNLVLAGDSLAIGQMGQSHRLADQRATVAVPFGKCSNPQNVAAEGYGCPIRHRCFGCASFSSDPSYLPEMRRRLLDLKAARARVDAFNGAAEWAKRDARPSSEEIAALEKRIHDEEDKLRHATPEQRALINEASTVLRKARAVAQVGLVLRRRNGEDALAAHNEDRRHVVDALGKVIDD